MAVAHRCKHCGHYTMTKSKTKVPRCSKCGKRFTEWSKADYKKYRK